MSIILDMSWLLALILGSLRVAGILISTPVLGFTGIPVRIRVLLVLGIAALTASIAPMSSSIPPVSSFAQLAVLGISEAILGAAMGFGLTSVFGAYMLAGRLLDYQMGFGIATLFDPSTATQSSLNGTLLSMLAAVLFLSVDAHHTLIRGISYSFSAVPIGSAGLPKASAVIAQFGLMFVFGFLLVAPAVVALMLIDFGVGIASRLMPQVNAYFVAMPIKVYAGIFLLALSMRFMEPVVLRSFEAVFSYWQSLLRTG